MESLYFSISNFHSSIGHSAFASHPVKIPRFAVSSFRSTPKVFAVNKTSRPDAEISAQEMFELFLSERQVTGDLISKASDMIWKVEFQEGDKPTTDESKELFQQSARGDRVDNEGRLLKLSQTKHWVSGDSKAPLSEKISPAQWQSDREKRKMIGLLEYEALKREILLLTGGIAAASFAYCYLMFTPQVAWSYALGAAGSCIYLQLLYYHTDNISWQNLSKVFRSKKVKKIGIQSIDVRRAFEKAFKGGLLAASSPRLLVPSALFGLWALLKHYFGDMELQLAPTIFGFFAYKGAIIVQIFRENEGFLYISSETDDNL
eukprot:TRINITY_DN3228_c0_g1_i3.p1 TRINITY_DN3228_c0_g1~~TRINITY_DN3228_c0_g1_i3.p1  ORF type:complete len:318 (-),score=61.87 TRINITY_DN3228_c0_g1_i3:169-1122(-)